MCIFTFFLGFFLGQHLILHAKKYDLVIVDDSKTCLLYYKFNCKINQME